MRIVVVLLLALPLAACSVTKELPHTAEGAASLQRIAGGEDVTVVSRVRRHLSGELLRVTADSVWVLPAEAERPETVAFADVLRVRQRTAIGGAVDGALAAGVVGLPVFAVFALTSAAASLGNERAGTAVGLTGAVLYLGIVAGGAVVGRRKGRQWDFVFVSDDEDASEKPVALRLPEGALDK